mmetsp:Transcript_86862/g.221239  ORF Transcript_86862/g.221239 Transcript_86862/m.221239 type:complete len:281 (+) Transcript_86862:98-940(+)
MGKRRQGVKAERYPQYVAFGPQDAWFIRWDSGEYAWKDVPPSLDKAIRRAQSKHQVGIESISMAPSGGWCMKCTCGTFEWHKLSTFLDDLLARSMVDHVTFGGEDCFFAWLSDGTTKWEGLPSELEDFVRSRAVSDLSIGCNGEWFSKCSDGPLQWSGASDDVHNDMQIHSPAFMTFGHTFGWYFIRWVWLSWPGILRARTHDLWQCFCAAVLTRSIVLGGRVWPHAAVEYPLYTRYNLMPVQRWPPSRPLGAGVASWSEACPCRATDHCGIALWGVLCG